MEGVNQFLAACRAQRVKTPSVPLSGGQAVPQPRHSANPPVDIPQPVRSCSEPVFDSPPATIASKFFPGYININRVFEFIYDHISYLIALAAIEVFRKAVDG
jgi:hypothetical protein